MITMADAASTPEGSGPSTYVLKR